MHTGVQFLRFGVVGLVSNALLFLVYLALTELGIGHKAAMSAVYLLGVVQTFVFNKKWSFRHSGGVSGAFIRYLIAYGLGYLVNLAVLVVLVDSFRFPHQIVQGIMILVLAVLLFLAQKYWVFPPRSIPLGDKGNITTLG